MGKIKESNMKLVNRDKSYTSKEAIEILMSCSPFKFDQSVDIAVNLGVDPRHADQLVRGTVVLPEQPKKDLAISFCVND